jgi:hypothetical protein
MDKQSSKYTNYSATSCACLIFMLITQIVIGPVSIKVVLTLKDAAATHRLLSKLMDSLN